MVKPYYTTMIASIPDYEVDTSYVVQIYYDGGHFDIIVDSEIADRHDMVLWNIHNCEGKFKHSGNNYYFEFESDAMAFKLKFA